MKPAPAAKMPTTPLMLTPRHEQILQAIHEYRYVTALDINNLLFSKGSLTYARSMLSALAGGKDQAERHYLYRFPFPTGSAGNRERVFTLGALGRDFLANVLGMPVDWYFRPYKSERLSHSHVLHHLLLTRFVVAAQSFTRNHPEINLLQSRLCHELARNQDMVADQKKQKAAKPAIIPDAWLLFALQSTGARYPVMLEIDRGTEFRAKFQTHMKARLEFIRSGEYKTVFDHPAVIYAYVTSGQLPSHAQARMKTMATWTQTVLTELGLPDWGVIFRFTSLSFDTLYEDIQSLLEQPVWSRPDKSEKVALFES
jgi:Replication-relaxation